MAYQINFGGLSTAITLPPEIKKGRKFRLAVLGDFSARANRGELESSDAAATRKPLKADVDNLNDLVERFAPKLQIELPGSGTVELEFASMQDFHPDALYEKLGVFSKLSGLRQRLKTPSTFAKAAKEMRDIGLSDALAPKRKKARKARGAVIRTDAKLSDFARFLGQPAAAAPEGGEADEQASLNAFLRRIVAPHVSAAKDPQQDKMVAAADQAISAMMREVLHHPDFQALESLWRSVEMLVRRLETDETLQIVLMDLSAEEFAADLSAGDELETTALYRLLVEGPAEDARTGMFSAIVGNYVFEQTPPHAELLGRLAKIAAQARAPFVAALATHTLDLKPGDLHELTQDAWDVLRALPEAGFLGLALPRFLLRLPYGEDTDSIDAFRFEEFTMQMGLRSLLWGNPAVIVGLLLAETFRKQGDKMNASGIISGIGEMPYYCYTDADGDVTALPCTERYLMSRAQEAIVRQGFLPLLAVKNSPEIRVGGYRALGGGLLAGWWLDTPKPVKEPEPEPAAQEESSETSDSTDEASTDSSSDTELDALLAENSDEPAEETSSTDTEAGMDPELAALLAELG